MERLSGAEHSRVPGSSHEPMVGSGIIAWYLTRCVDELFAFKVSYELRLTPESSPALLSNTTPVHTF